MEMLRMDNALIVDDAKTSPKSAILILMKITLMAEGYGFIIRN
jgi:hypothetical protein